MGRWDSEMGNDLPLEGCSSELQPNLPAERKLTNLPEKIHQQADEGESQVLIFTSLWEQEVCHKVNHVHILNFLVDTFLKLTHLNKIQWTHFDPLRPLRVSVKPMTQQEGTSSAVVFVIPTATKGSHGCPLRPCVGMLFSSFLCSWAVNITCL